MTNTQMAFALLLPTLTVLTGILVSNNQFGTLNGRLSRIESELSDTRQRLSHMEGSLGVK